MKLSDLSPREKVAMIGSSVLGAVQIFSEKNADEVTTADLKTLRERLNRTLDLIEESRAADEGTMQ